MKYKYFINIPYRQNLLLLSLIIFSFGCTEEDKPTATLEISPSTSYDFGDVTTSTSQDQTLTVTNSGLSEAINIEASTLTAPFEYKGGSFPGTAGTCTTTLDIDETCDIVLTFSPTVDGSATDEMILSYYNNSVITTATLALAGNGVTASGPGAGTLVISDGPTYDFGSLLTGNTADHSFTVSNIGVSAATAVSGSGLAAPFSFQGGAYPGTGGTCGATIASGASCSVVVTFAPIALGASSDTLTINYVDGVASAATRDILGTGI